MEQVAPHTLHVETDWEGEIDWNDESSPVVHISN